MKKLYLFTLMLYAILFMSCRLNIPPEKQVEDWIAMIDVDGNNLQFICRDISTPYFIPDPDNPGEEIILLDGGIIELMNLDGSNRRTIIDSVDNINCFSEDRTKMLLATNNGEIYIANTDGSGLENLTNTPDIYEWEPSFSFDKNMVTYWYPDFQDSIYVISCKDLTTGFTYNIYEEEYNSAYYYVSPVFIDVNTVIFGQNYSISTGISGLYSWEIDTGNKTLIDPGSISAKMSYNRNANMLAYNNFTSQKLYHTDTGEIDVIEGNYGYNVPAYFNRDGSLLTFKSYVIDTSTLEGYNILRYYDDDANIDSNPIDFNETSTKVIMKVSRIFPNSNEE